MTSDQAPQRAYTATQIYEALLPLGHAPVFDPDKRPGGPLEEDRPTLLGMLLAITELAMLSDPPETAEDFNMAYAKQAIAGRQDSTNLAVILAVRFSRLEMLLDTMQGGPILQAAARNAASTSGLLNIWLLARVGRAIDTDDAAMLRQAYKNALADLKSARSSFEIVRRQLNRAGFRL